MKKILALLLALCLTLSLCACGAASKPSGVTIEDFETEVIKEIDDEGSLSVTQTDGGYTFEYKGESLLGYDMVISGTADAKKNITYVQAETKGGINIEYINSLTATQLYTDTNDWEHIAGNKLNGEFFLFNFAYVVKLCSEEQSAEDHIMGIDLLLTAIRSPQVDNNWTYSVTTNAGEESILITATYAAK